MTQDGDAAKSSVMAGMLYSLTHICVRRPLVTLLVLGLFTAGSVAYSAARLKLKTDRADLIDPAATFHQRWLRYTESFGESSDMVVVVEADRPETIKHALDVLGDKLQREPAIFTNVLYKIEPGKLRSKGLQYLPPDSLAKGLNRLEEYRPILKGRWDLVRLDSLIPLIRLQLQRLSQQGQQDSPALWEHARILTESLARFAEDRNDFINPWPVILPVDLSLQEQENQTVYTLNETGTVGFLLAAPTDKGDSFEGATPAIDRLRQLVAETVSEIPDSRISITGIPVLENDEMRRSQIDSTRAGVISFVGVTILFFLGFRGFLHPALGMIVLAIGMAWSYGFTTLVIGHLNILSIAFASIVIGLGNDFAIHVLSRYLDLRHQGRELRRALVETSASIGPGIVTGAVTTSLAFFCAALTPFLGVAELGIIAGGGILLCTVATFTALPALVALADRRSEEQSLPVPFQGRWLGQFTRNFPLTVLMICGCFIGWVAYKSFDWSHGTPTPLVKYDHNLLNLQAEGLESVEAQKRIFESSKNSLLYAISLADSAEEARSMKAKLEALPTVHHVEELASRLPQAPSYETRLFVQAFHAYLSKLPEQPTPPETPEPEHIGRALEEFYSFLKTSDRSPQAARIADNLDRFLNRLDQLDLRQQMTLLGEFDYRLAYSLLGQFQAIESASNAEPVTPEDLPPELRARYVSPAGKWLLQIFPKDQIWDMEPLERFVTDVRTIDPEVTGTPLQNFEAALQIKESYEICAVYSLVVILLVLLVDFLQRELMFQTFVPPAIAIAGLVALMLSRGMTVSVLPLTIGYTMLVFALAAIWDRAGLIDTLVAIVPPILGLLLTLGLLAVFDIPLNPANLIILPLIIGIGVDNGVHVLHDFHSKPNEIYSPSASMVNAIAMTSSTSIVGFGSMMISAHRGMRSLGAVLSIGVCSCLLMSMVVLPAVLAVLSRVRQKGRGVRNIPLGLPAPLEAIAAPATTTSSSQLLSTGHRPLDAA